MGVDRNKKLVRALVTAAAVLVTAVLPGVARAHHPDLSFQAGQLATAPTIDGVLGAGEWSGVPVDEGVVFGAMPATVRFAHDGEFAYAAVTVADGVLGPKSFGIFFDDNHDGVKDPGEDALRAGIGPSTGEDLYYSTSGTNGANHYLDTSLLGTDPPGDGTNDVVAAGSEVGGIVTFEVRRPLCAGDAVHDFCLDVGSSVGLLLQYQSGDATFLYPAASSPFEPAAWPHLTLTPAAPAGVIVFESTRDGQHEIYRMNADGSAQTRLTDNPATDNLPSISPDGTKVAFTSDREGSQDIFVMDIAGGGVTRLTFDAGTELQPAWSPDGTKIAYTGSSIGQFDIFVVDAAGGAPVNVTNAAADEGNAAWSPDGTQLAFTSTRDGNNEIYRGPADGSGAPTRLTNNSADDHDPDWSPDGQKLAIYSDRPPLSGCCGSIWTINASDGSGATNL